VAGADDVADAGEQVGFTNSSRRSARTGEDDDEQRVAEGFQFRPAVSFQGVGDRQFVQVELALQVGQFLWCRFLQAGPDEMLRLAGPAVAVFQGISATFLPLL
jgi:hypothetical protein